MGEWEETCGDGEANGPRVSLQAGVAVRGLGEGWLRDREGRSSFLDGSHRLAVERGSLEDCLKASSLLDDGKETVPAL